MTDRTLRILVANQAAERLMGDGLLVHQGRLRACGPEQQQALVRFMKAVLEKTAAADDLGPLALRRPSGRKPLLLQAIPAAGQSETAGLPHGTAVLVLVVDPEQDARPDAERQLRLLGLTRSEARLAALIGTGYSRAQAAEALNLSQSTVADAIKDIYAKLDMSRQSQLVRLLDRLAVLKP